MRSKDFENLVVEALLWIFERHIGVKAENRDFVATDPKEIVAELRVAIERLDQELLSTVEGRK